MGKKKGKPVDETVLYDLKWFDYMGLKPDEATIVNAGCFTEAFLRFEKHNQARKFYNVFQTFNLKNLGSWKYYKVFTKHRQKADKFGLKYEDYWGLAWQAANDWGLVKLYPQIFFSNSIFTFIQEQVAEKYTTQIKKSRLTYFRAENYRGEQLQNEYYEYLLYEAKKRYRDRATQIVRSMVESGEISPVFFSCKNTA